MRIPGLDISHFNGFIDWPKVKAAGYQFVFIKATDGINFIDEKFAANWKGAGDVGLLRGAYHFLRPSSDPYLQLNHFLKTVEATFAKPELPPVLDFEIIGLGDIQQQKDKALQWMVSVQKSMQREPIFYSNLNFIENVLGGIDLFKDFPLWLAEYSLEPKIPCKFWQCTEKGKVDGIFGDVDLDYFNGTYQELISLK